MHDIINEHAKDTQDTEHTHTNTIPCAREYQPVSGIAGTHASICTTRLLAYLLSKHRWLRVTTPHPCAALIYNAGPQGPSQAEVF